MNKNLMFIVVGVLVLVGLIGSIVLQVLRPEALGTFVQQIVVIVGVLVSAAGTIYGLGQVNTKIEQVERQTNGQLTKLQTERDQLANELAATRELLAATTGTIPMQEQ